MSTSWTEIKLGDILAFANGKGIKPGGIGKYPVYGSNGIIGGSEIHKHSDAVIIGRVGAYCGSVMYCKNQFWASDNTIIAKPISGSINIGFSYLLLQSINLNRYAGGAAQPLLTQIVLKQVETKVPSLLIQKKIAAIIFAYDNLIENNTRRIQILEEMAQRIYKEWFVDFKYPGHENDHLVDSELGMIPEGWELKKTGEVFGIIGGGTPSTKVPGYWENGTINWYSPKDLTKSDSMFALTSGSQISDLGLQKSSAKLFPAFSVMLTSRATIGVVAINTTEACTNQGFITCIPSENMSTYQIYYWLLNNIKMFLAYSSGATFKELTKTTFKKFDLVVPPKKTSSLFNELVIPIASEILTLQKQNGNLSQTRDLLLPKLISGKIDVSDLEIDTSILND